MFDKSNIDICPWCEHEININGLIGINTNQCPDCGNPVFPRNF